jgi:uncharacterized protein YheU (UPF0270 family)
MDIPESAVEVPHRELAPDTLRRVAEEFVTRDGTDYGDVELSLETKVANLLRQLESGDAHIYFDSESETLNIVAAREFRTSAPDVTD